MKGDPTPFLNALANAGNAQVVRAVRVGQNVTVTILVGDTYYTAHKVSPDFRPVPDKAELSANDTAQKTAVASARQLVVRDSEQRGQATLEHEAAKCLLRLLFLSAEVRPVTFASFRGHFLEQCGLERSKPTNRAYYEAMCSMVTAWRYATSVLTGK